MVNDLNHTHRKKPKLALPTSKSQDNFSNTLNPFSDNQALSINNTNGITSPPPFYTKRPKKVCLTRLHKTRLPNKTKFSKYDRDFLIGKFTKCAKTPRGCFGA